MVENRVSAVVRTSFGKGAARKLRASGKIPAVVYGREAEPIHVALPAHETTLIARRANALIELDLAEAEQLVLIKDVQRDPVRQIIEHLDLVTVKKGEKVSVDVSIHTEGEPFSGTMVQFDHSSVSLEAEATDIPEFISVSVEGLEEGSQIYARDLVLPEGSNLQSDPETLILSIQLPAKTLEIEPEDVQDGEESGESGSEGESDGGSESAGGEASGGD